MFEPMEATRKYQFRKACRKTLGQHTVENYFPTLGVGKDANYYTPVLRISFVQITENEILSHLYTFYSLTKMETPIPIYLPTSA